MYLVLSIRLATSKQLEEAFDNAKKAQKQWAKSRVEERRDVLNKAAKYLKENREEIVSIIGRETGGSVLKASFELHLTLEFLEELALQVDAGMTHINDQTVNDAPHTPFGGNKASGVGRFGNPWVVEEFTMTKWVSVQTKYRQFAF